LADWAIDSEKWPRPVPSSTTILIGSDLGEGAMVQSARQEAPEVRQLIPAVSWALLRRRALRSATDAGTIVTALTSESVLDAIEGRLGRHVQIVGHIDESGGKPLLVCDDALVDLRKLVEGMRNSRRAGFLSPLAAADLTACNSSGELSEAFHEAGVFFVSSVAAPIHPARVLSGLNQIYGVPLLKGTLSFQHAWIRADIGPTSVGGGISQQHESA
jgi:hypothetical protein